MSTTVNARPTFARRCLRTTMRWSIPVLVLGIAAGIWQRERIWTWYCAERLVRATDDDRSDWAAKLGAGGEQAVPAVLRLLANDDPRVCAAAKIALEKMLSDWRGDEDRCKTLALRILDASERFSTPGRSTALELLPSLLRARHADVLTKARALIAMTAQSEALDLRLQSIATALQPEVNCLDAIVPLLEDERVEVRRAAVIALASVRDGEALVIGDDVLLRRLHDADDDVRQFAEMGLRGRGRSPREIRLGKLYAAPHAAERQKLLNDLAVEDELDVAVWLERLTNDVDPAVRAGAARVASDRRTELGGRLQQMSRNDPDATVRVIAAYYHRKMMASR